MTNPTFYLPVTLIQDFINDTFIRLGVPTDDARICADVLITSDLRGIESHGVGRLKYYYDRIKSGQHQVITNITVIKETLSTAVLDGNHGMGMIIGTHAMSKAIEKAKIVGLGAVAVRNSTHFGIDGYYALMAVKENMVGLSFTNARPSIAPTFGVEPMLGTNPIAFGAPTDGECPFLFDAATSIIQRGKVEVHSREEKILESGYVVDQNNQFMTDPDFILSELGKKRAAFLPLGGEGEIFGGYKGYDLATMVEILCASFQNGSFLNALSGLDDHGHDRTFNVGHFFLAINIGYFTDIELFKQTTGNILRDLQNSKKAPGHDHIYFAGEKEFESEKIIRVKGIPIIPNLQKELKFIQNDLNLTGYEFPF